SFEDLLAIYWVIWLGYSVLVIGGCAWMIWWRSGMVSVYNIEPAAFDDTLAQTLDRLGLAWIRMGDRVIGGYRNEFREPGPGTSRDLRQVYSTQIKPKQLPAPVDPNLPNADPVSPHLLPALRRDQEAVFDIQAFPSTRHVSLIWRIQTEPL